MRRCGAPLADGRLCGLAAGWGTDHVGIARCRHHAHILLSAQERHDLAWGEQWSASLCETYLACPRRCYLAYAQREPGRPPALFDVGSRFHLFAERYARHCYEMRDGPHGGRSDRVFGSELAAAFAPDPDDSNLRSVLSGFIQNIEFEWSDILATSERQIEAVYSAALPDRLGVFIGHPDLVAISADGVCTVLDWKTHWWAPSIIIESPDDLYDDPPPQLVTYCWLLLQTYPSITAFEASYLYVRKGRSADWELSVPQVAECPYLPVIREIKARIEEGRAWLARPGYAACDACSYVASCTEVDGLDLERPETAAQAIAMLEEAQRLQARGKHLSKAARDFAQAHGPLRLADGTRVGYEEETEFFVEDRDLFYELVEGEGHNPRRIAGEPPQETLEELVRGMGRIEGIDRAVRSRFRRKWRALNVPRGRASRLQVTDDAASEPS